MKTALCSRVAAAAASVFTLSMALGQSCEPVLLGAADSPNRDYAVAMDGPLAFVCDLDTSVPLDHALVVLDFTDIAAPIQIGSLDLADGPWDVVVRDGLAYVAADDEGLLIVDVSDPSAPVLIGQGSGPSGAQGVDLANGFAYVAGGRSDGLWIFDITDPAAPVSVGFVTMPQHAFKVRVAGSRAFVASLGGGLQIVDVSAPAAPAVLGSLDYTCSGCSVNDVVVVDDLAYLAVQSWGLRIVDVSDPTAPVEVGEYRMDDLAYGVAVRGSTVLVGGASGLSVFDASDPTLPVMIGSLQTTPAGSAFRPALRDDLAFVPVRGAGPLVIDIGSCFGSGPCNDADFAEPFGVLDTADVSAFVDAFLAAETGADLDASGVFDLRDVTLFIGLFVGGCPS